MHPSSDTAGAVGVAEKGSIYRIGRNLGERQGGEEGRRERG